MRVPSSQTSPILLVSPLIIFRILTLPKKISNYKSKAPVFKLNTGASPLYLINMRRDFLNELLSELIPQQILDGLLLQTGNFLHGVDGVLHSLTDM